MTESSSDPLAFTPVPSRSTRHDGWTAERQRAFIKALSELGIVAAAARVVGKSTKSAYALRKRPGAESFAAAWDRALDEGYDQALDTVINRVYDGVLVPIIYRGRQVGVKRKHDNKLLMAALRIRARLREAGAPKEEWDF